MLIGDLVRALGAQRLSFASILGGEIISGVSSTSIDTSQSKIYTNWFRGTTADGPGLISFITGLDISMNRIFFMAAQAAVPFFHAIGIWYWSFWLDSFFSAFAFVLNILYLFFETRFPAESPYRSQDALLCSRTPPLHQHPPPARFLLASRHPTDPRVWRRLFVHV